MKTIEWKIERQLGWTVESLDIAASYAEHSHYDDMIAELERTKKDINTVIKLANEIKGS